MPNNLVSFRKFLQTGRLGPISADMTLMDVARVLGGPDRFILSSDQTVPLYWCYNKLEISFAEDVPHRIEWFQIEYADCLDGDFEVIVDDMLAMTLDGFDNATKPSEFLLQDVWSPNDTIVTLRAISDDILLNIKSGPIRIYFRVDTDFLQGSDAGHYLRSNRLEDVVRTIDTRTQLDSIYSYSSSDQDFKASDATSINGATYLAALYR
ncbi:hypothetical protein [Oryzicola mucosus]|uniref:Uncharacterized protein n=1 Tax=Oryzicola mucosus TaxID=2767425 RepID=A0A8J6U133_9HYPH|nr:hypothetical protein [Oryzicola mucosus]MBD0413773.1 hypothetical protein [Oryzicola mucosus]